MLRDRQCVQIHVLAQHLYLFYWAIIDHHRFSTFGGHLFGQVGADFVCVIKAERCGLPGAVLDQDICEPPVIKTRHVVEHQRPLALGAQISDLCQRIDRVVDVQHPIVDGFKESAQ